MTFNNQTKNWLPVGGITLEPNADKVVRSNTNYSVIAGPGAGKTELLAQRACYLFQTGLCPDPYRILAISFKNDSANNLKERVAERCSKQDAMRFDSLTFAAFAKSMLDRFIGSVPKNWRPKQDYELYTKEYEYENELRNFLIRLSKESCQFIKLKDYRVENFKKSWVFGSPLLLEGIPQTSIESIAVQKWWNTCLHIGGKSKITFQMIERLVELLIKSNPQIMNALRLTYSYVFMDEFQDTTHIQYDIIKTGFLNSQTILTAVGDNKQQIMKWAMAMDNAFEFFEKDFQAKSISLILNYRSSPELVEIQHQIALTVDSNYKNVESKKQKNITEESCVIWDFTTPASEAKYLAKTISDSINIYQLIPNDFVLLVKKEAKNYINHLEQSFSEYDLKIRLTEANDILDKPLTKIIIKFLRFVSKEGSPNPYWSDCLQTLINIHGIDPTDDRNVRELQDKLENFRLSLINKMSNFDSSYTYKYINTILAEIEGFLQQDYIKLAYPEYRQGNEYNDILKEIKRQITLSYRRTQNKSCKSILDDFEGLDSVPLMTIHKSKGLEYHTVIFLGLDDSAWKYFEDDPQASRSTFFVAFSRAKQRVIFTYCKQRGARNKISSLYELLEEAGVKTIEPIAVEEGGKVAKLP
ncbi:UvrD-helicase domain-containing protein [Anabaena sp. UHCC 0204]|uniref:UvrD-helicase domain-containing protein n=1 Tax=Anabaena sp. UHCC 0204 TaxID=2590009 RepID=UPI001445E742|nr:ATP-dependent helicase [Anabaena sp. UHCC 0204]MTJ10779.1 ATP-dependent helicase [Anabaena sp. UHCC 0204]